MASVYSDFPDNVIPENFLFGLRGKAKKVDPGSS
jgi:hypothetical protein